MSGKAKILIVEDDLNLMEGIREILEIHEYDVLTATNGLAGLETLRQQTVPPDLILSDIMMPHMNGYEFFKAVRAEPRWTQTQFVFLTAKGERDDIMFGKGLGSDDYVVKPFDAKDLLTTIEAKLRRREQIGQFLQHEIAELKRKVLTIINHEMRTPLTYVVAYSDMLNRDAEDLTTDDMRTFLRGINAGANRLRRMVENFILLVELQTNEARKTFDWRRARLTNYAALMRVIESKYRDIADEMKIQVQIEIAPNLSPINADQEYLSAAIECLLDNAIKFSDEHQMVKVRVYQQDQHVCFGVIDRGRGIPEHELQNIFKTFYQIDRENLEDQGAGSGLAIVDGVVRLHGGHVTVESTFGSGSTFTIHLPAEKSESDIDTSSSSESLRALSS